MDRERILRIVAETTGGLRPAPGVTDDDLGLARSLIARSLLGEEWSEAGGLAAADELERLLGAFPAEVDATPLDARASAELHALLDATPAEAHDAALSAFRIHRRDLPISGVGLSGITPTATSGAAIERSLGPFVTADGRHVWFDLFRIVRLAAVLRLPGGAPLLFASVRDRLGNGTSYEIDRGSLWISSTALTPSAPAGAYAGLRVVGGRLELSSSASVAGAIIQVGASTTLTVTVELEHMRAADPNVAPGGDARGLSVELPREVSFVLSPGGTEVRVAHESHMRLYGSSIRLEPSGGPVTYEPAIGRILVPHEVRPRSLQIADVRSRLFTPLGGAPIEWGAWSLPVALVSPTRLTDAAGVGELAVVTAPGLRGRWRGLAGGSAGLGRVFFLAERGRLTVVAPSAGGRRLTQTCHLWRDSEDSSRHCSVDLAYRAPALLTFVSSASGAEIVVHSGAAVAHLDRPVRADGRRLRVAARDALVVLGDDAAGSTIFLLALAAPQIGSVTVRPPEPIAFALSNALIKTTPPLAFLLFGRLQDERMVQAGILRLHFGLLLLLPTLPDPYAANLQNPREALAGAASGQFVATVQWSDPAAPSMTLAFSEGDVPLEASLAPSIARADRYDPIGSMRGRVGPRQEQIVEDDRRRVERLRERFQRAIGAAPESILLLDVSTNADQFGVGLGFPGRRGPLAPSTPPPLTIDGVSLATRLRNARVFTVPQIQWEPVWTIQNPDLGLFPSPLGAADDGGPTLIGIDTARLVPIAPHPVVGGLIHDFRREEDSADAAALFTLPFGMKAVAAPLRRAREVLGRGASLDLVAPEFANPRLAGGLQIALRATGSLHTSGDSTVSLPGAAVQTRNGIDPATRMPLFVSVLGDSLPPATDDDAPNAVESIFNAEFAPGGTSERVPLTRIDFSGYGASTFSRWRNPSAEIAATSKVEFDTLVGRAAHEVIQVRSLLYPWGVRVVRTITIQRSGSGGVFRRDSGWVAVTDGVFDFPVHVSVPTIETHPGVVKAAVNVRRIRDTTHVYRREYGSGPSKVVVRLAAVKFDADIRIPEAVRGATGGHVTSIDQIGFVQLAPAGAPLSPEQYADLLAEEGPLGGGVDCMIDVGRSGQLMRVTRVDVGCARTKGGQAEFVAAARGALLLPRNGQWSTVKQSGHGSTEAEPVDRHTGIAVVREGKTGLDDGLNPAPYRFAEPAYLLDLDSAPADPGLLWSTGMQRVLFRRPRIDRGARAITGDRKPLLADAYAIIGAAGIFPSAANCLEVPFASWSLDIPSEGHVRLSMPSSTFPAIRASGGAHRDLSVAGTLRMFVDYTNTRFTLELDSQSATSWRYRQDGIAHVNESDGVRVKTSHGHIHAESGRPERFTLEAEEFGEKLDKAKPLMPMFASTDLAGAIPSGGAEMPIEANNKAEGQKTKFGVKREFPIPPEIPVLIGVTGKNGYLELSTNFQTFFKMDLVLDLVIAHLFPAAARFKYDAEALKEKIPGTSIEHTVGSKEELQLAIGIIAAPPPIHVLFCEVEFKAFAGIGFVHEAEPGEKSIGIGAVFCVKGTASYPSTIINLASVGITIEGQGLFLFEGDKEFLALKGTVAVDVTVALFLNVEFEVADVTLVKLEL